MIGRVEYSYFIKKESGIIVLGKVVGLSLLSPEDLFPRFVREKNFNIRELKRLFLSQRAELYAESSRGKRYQLLSYNPLVSKKLEGPKAILDLFKIAPFTFFDELKLRLYSCSFFWTILKRK